MNSKKKPAFPFPITNFKGSALIMVSIFMVVASVLITVGTLLVTTSRKQANEQTYAVALAENAAQAGLEDTIGWFKRQTTQPVAANPLSLYGAPPNPTPTYPATITTNAGALTVTYSDEAFYPVYNTANPVSTDTIDGSVGTTIGLVNEFSPDGAGSVSEATTDGSQSRWERYEVQRQLTGAAVTNGVHDVTGSRVYGKYNGQGLVWSIQSTGYYYLRRDFTKSVSAPYYWAKDYKTPPNVLLATASMVTEIRKIATSMPWSLQAALYMPDPRKLNLATNTVVNYEKQASSYAYAVATPGSPVTAGAGELQGSGYVTTGGGTAPLAANNVFGLSVTDFATLDTVVKPSSNPISFGAISSNSIIYYNGSVTIDPAGSNPNDYVIGPNGLQTGILIVNGNFTMNSSSNQSNAFYGLVYVTGSVNLGGSSINGALIMGNNSTGVTLTAVGGMQGAINYNPSVLLHLQTQVSGYLEDVSARKKFLAIPNF